MSFYETKAKALSRNLFQTIDNDWLLICCEDREHQRENMMTASWGGFGILWNREVCFLFVRPQRHTHKLLAEQERFSVAVLPDSLKDAHKVCGRLSGRNTDKIEKTGLTEITLDGVKTLDEAELVLIVKKIYEDDLKKECFLDETLFKNYPADDFHTVYVCEIEKVYIKE